MATRATSGNATEPLAKPAARSRSAAAGTRTRPSAAKAFSCEDFEQARQLLARYCMLIDQGNLEGLSELFHRQAVFSVSFDSVKSHTGRDAVLAWYTRFFRERPGKVGFPRHKLFEPCIVADGHRLVASSYFDSDFVEASGAVRILAGRYDDVLVKERGCWYFKQRSILIHHHYSPGQATPGMAS